MTGDHGNSEMVEIHHPPASIPGREFDLLRAFAFGMNISECAIQLNISKPTAATYRTRLMTKLELMSTTSASRELLEPSSAETVKPLARLPDGAAGSGIMLISNFPIDHFGPSTGLMGFYC